MSAAPKFLDIFDAYATDETAEVEGRWFPIGARGRVKVARTGNSRYNELFKKKVEDKQLDLQDGGPAAEQLAEQILIEVQAATILLDWQDLGFQGEAVVYSQDMAKTMLGVKDFRRKINALADSFENFRVKREEQQGNA